MRVVVIADKNLQDALQAQGVQEGIAIDWVTEIPTDSTASCYIDLLFTPTTERIDQLSKLLPALLIVNAVPVTLNQLPENFVRINGWPGFLNRNLVEATSDKDTLKIATEKIFAFFNKTVEWVDDRPGFITATILCMIINESFFALEEGVSSREEIDIALKLGTNYPYGPFEWCKKIGVSNVLAVLKALAVTNARYTPAPLLEKEIDR